MAFSASFADFSNKSARFAVSLLRFSSSSADIFGSFSLISRAVFVFSSTRSDSRAVSAFFSSHSFLFFSSLLPSASSIASSNGMESVSFFNSSISLLILPMSALFSRAASSTFAFVEEISPVKNSLSEISFTIPSSTALFSPRSRAYSSRELFTLSHLALILSSCSRVTALSPSFAGVG